MKPRTYSSPAAFKAALDQRLRNVAEPAIGITRRRQLLVFDRQLARLARVLGSAATLKGGLALELRLDRARTTRDIDLRLVGSPEGLVRPGTYLVTVEGASARGGPWETVGQRKLSALERPHPLTAGPAEVRGPARLTD